MNWVSIFCVVLHLSLMTGESGLIRGRPRLKYLDGVSPRFLPAYTKSMIETARFLAQLGSAKSVIEVDPNPKKRKYIPLAVIAVL